MDAFFNSIGFASWGLHFLLWFPVVAMFVPWVSRIQTFSSGDPVALSVIRPYTTVTFLPRPRSEALE